MTANRPCALTIVRRLGAAPTRDYAAITTGGLIQQWSGPDSGPTLRVQADVPPCMPARTFLVTYLPTPMRQVFDGFLNVHRLPHMERVLAGRAWLVGTLTVADILMADVLRLVDRFDGLADFPACKAYVARATARPAFEKAHADQMAHFAAADQAGPSQHPR